MRKLLSLFSVSVFLFGIAAFAQDGGVTPPSGEELNLFLQSLGGVGSLKAVGIVLLVVQGLMLFFRSKLADFAGKYKLLIVTALTLIASICAGLVSGQSISASILSGGALATLQVFMNQIYTQFFLKKE